MSGNETFAAETEVLLRESRQCGYDLPCRQSPKAWDAPDSGIERPNVAAERVAQACRECGYCKAFDLCGRAARAERSPRGVWAGEVFYDPLSKEYNEKVRYHLTNLGATV